VDFGGAYGFLQDYLLNFGLLVPAAPLAAAALINESSFG
jgi:hypothetical protein